MFAVETRVMKSIMTTFLIIRKDQGCTVCASLLVLSNHLLIGLCILLNIAEEAMENILDPF